MTNRPIKICPAILEKDEDILMFQLKAYSDLFSQIDIDINIEYDIFPGQETVHIDRVVELIQQNNLTNNFAFHLMTQEPGIQIVNFLKNQLFKPSIIFIHQESNYQDAVEEFKNDFNFGIAIKAESKLEGIDLYRQFKEIQLMTIETGKQGGGFLPEILNRVEELRSMGFEGTISIDGGVNLETAELIKQHSIDRVSVGSYFSKSSNLKDDLEKLNAMLNS